MSNKDTVEGMSETNNEQMPLTTEVDGVTQIRSTMKVEEAARVLGISRAIAYRSAQEFLESEGKRGLPVIQIGRRLLVPKAQLDALLTGTTR